MPEHYTSHHTGLELAKQWPPKNKCWGSCCSPSHFLSSADWKSQQKSYWAECPQSLRHTAAHIQQSWKYLLHKVTTEQNQGKHSNRYLRWAPASLTATELWFCFEVRPVRQRTACTQPTTVASLPAAKHSTKEHNPYSTWQYFLIPGHKKCMFSLLMQPKVWKHLFSIT